MATKPSGTFTIATNLNFDAGDRIGSPTKVAVPDVPNGFTPGTPVTAEAFNYTLNILGDWSIWLLAGSALAGLDRHLVETDANGGISVASMVLGGTASGSFPMRVTPNTGASSVLILFTNNLGGDCINATVTNGSGNPIDATCGSAATGAAVRARQNNASASAAAVDAESAGSGPAVLGVATGTGGGGRFVSDHDGGPAVACEQGSVGTPARGRLWIEPTAAPSAASDGDVWKIIGVTGFGRGKLQFHDLDGAEDGGSAGKLTVHASPGGLGFQYAESLGVSDESAGVLDSKLSMTLGADASPGAPDGRYLIEFFCMVYLDAGADPGTSVWVEFHGPSGILHNQKIVVDFDAVNQMKHVSFFDRYDYSGGADVFEIFFRTSDAAEEVHCLQARIVARGTYG